MEIKISRVIMGYYAVIIFLLLLPLILPIYVLREFNDDGEVLSEGTFHMLNIAKANPNFFYGFLGFLALSILSLGIPLFIANRREGKPGRVAYISGLISFLPIYHMDQNFRAGYIRGAYQRSSMFGNVMPAYWGYIGYFIGFLLIFTLRYFDHTMDANEFVEYIISSAKSTISKLWGPTTVQYLALHVVSLVIMMISYSIGFSTGAFWEAPSYYLDLIYTYGLNGGLETPSFILTLSWVLAPMIVIPVGFLLFLLKTSGFAPNGAPLSETVPENRYIQLPRLDYETWAYFSQDVPLADVYLGSPKISGFYMITILGSLLLGLVIGSVIRYYVFGQENGVAFYSWLGFYTLVAIFFGITFSAMSAPVLIIPGGIVTSVFFERNQNRFIRYRYLLPDQPDNGFYHPATTMIALIIFLTPVAILSVILDMGIGRLLAGKFFEKKESEQIVGRYIDESQTELPWET